MLDLSTDAGRQRHGLRLDSLEYMYARRDKEVLLGTPITREMVLCTLDTTALRLPARQVTVEDVHNLMDWSAMAIQNAEVQVAFTRSLAYTRAGGTLSVV